MTKVFFLRTTKNRDSHTQCRVQPYLLRYIEQLDVVADTYNPSTICITYVKVLIEVFRKKGKV